MFKCNHYRFNYVKYESIIKIIHHNHDLSALKTLYLQTECELIRKSMNKYLYNNIKRCILLSVCTLAIANVASGQSERSIDGFGNNEANPTWGASFEVQPRWSPSDYSDGISEGKLGTLFRPQPRVISNVLFAQDDKIDANLELSDFTWVFGQFIDHDIILSETTTEQLDNIVIPDNDEFFNPGAVIRMFRHEAAEGTGITTPREHVNNITAFLDLSNVYGSDEDRATWLRTLEDGKLKVGEGNMLPWNTMDGNFNGNLDPNAPHMADDTRSLVKMYVAGDVRANENPLLIAYHTLFVREHNRLCDIAKDDHPGWNDERLYQDARKKLIAYYQKIIFTDWLPSLGVNLPAYSGYKENINPQIHSEFSTAAFRMGHTLINSSLIRMGNDGEEIKSGNISLKDAFFNPLVVEYVGGIEPYLIGMATQVSQEFDCKVIDDVRNFLFTTPGSAGLDLAAININRGRERGISDYNTIRGSLGMPRFSSFLELTQNAEEAATLEDLYGDIDDVDPWVGMLAEPHVDGGLFGSLVTTILVKQFQALREGDRFYYRNMDFDESELADIETVTMRKILMRNTNISLMQEDVFRAMPHGDIESGPELIPFPLEAIIYPNPVLDDLHIKVFGSKDEVLTVSVINYMGRLVDKTNINISKGSNTLDIDSNSYPRGFYNVILETENRVNVLKMIKR